MSDLTESIEALDDGTQTAREIADKLDCHISNVVHLRNDWWNKRINGGNGKKRRCRRCDFFPSEQIPFVNGENLCLWCWLSEQGKSWKEFYTSGEWKQYVDYRPGAPGTVDKISKELRERVKEAMELREHSCSEAAKAAGCLRQTWMCFLTKDTYRIGSVTAEAAARYLGIEATPKGIARMFDMHPRRVAMLVQGW
jgi:hypothetical protein